MRSIRIMSAMVVVICAATAAIAQETKEAPKIEPVITHIPAGSMGYAAVHSIDESVKRVEAWLTDTGLDKVIPGDIAKGQLLKKLLDKLPVGEGFNTNGGAAIVMLDANKFNVDLPKLILRDTGEAENETTVAPAETQPATMPREEEKDIKLPFVIFVPGTTVEETFDGEKFTITQAGKYKKLERDGEEMIAGKIGSYIILSPRADALDAVIASKKNALEELGRDKGNLVMDSGIVCHVNMTLSAPTINAIIKRFKEGDTFGYSFFSQMLSPFKVMAEMAPFYTYAFSQMETFTFTGKAGKTGLLANILVDWKPDSLFAKTYPANKGEVGELLDKVPNFGFIFAMGATLERGKESEEITLKRVDAILANEHISPHVSKETKDVARKLALDIHKQVDRWQLVIGGPPENSKGMMGMGIVMHCEDAEKVKELLSQSTTLIEDIVDGIRTNKDCSSAAAAADGEEKKEGEEGEEEDPDKIKFTYTKAAETCGELKVDTIDIKHRSLDQFAGMTPSPLTMYIGEDRLRIRIASPDKNTVVLTFGGGKEMVTETLKAAKAKKPLLTEKQAQEILKHLPQNCSTMALMNPGNFITLPMKMASAMFGESTMVIPEFGHLPPVAFGSAAIGKIKYGVIYVPNELIKEMISSIQAMQHMQENSDESIEDGEDF